MNYKCVFFLCFFFIVVADSAHAQQKTYTTSLKYHNGFILPHHQSISYVRKSDIEGFEINFGFIPSSKKKWAKLYKQPEVGLAFYHSNLGNNEVWGNASALFPYINFQLFKIGQFSLTNHLGIGLAYNNKTNHPNTNYKNILISSKLNAFFSLAIEGEYALNSQWQMVAGVGLKHISNGASKKPNKGINLIVSTMGIKYALKERPAVKNRQKYTFQKLNNEYTITWHQGRKQAKENDKHKYYITNISANYALGLNAKQRVGFGLDFFYDESANRGKWDLNPKTSFKHRFSQGLHISHDLLISDLTFTVQIGAYTFYKTEPELPIYTRLGLRYNLGQRFFTNINLKAHGGKADHIEWGLGFRFQNKN